MRFFFAENKDSINVIAMLKQLEEQLVRRRSNGDTDRGAFESGPSPTDFVLAVWKEVLHDRQGAPKFVGLARH